MLAATAHPNHDGQQLFKPQIYLMNSDDERSLSEAAPDDRRQGDCLSEIRPAPETNSDRERSISECTSGEKSAKSSDENLSLRGIQTKPENVYDYEQDREYFSDPDYHDDRPQVKKQTSRSAESTTSDDERSRHSASIEPSESRGKFANIEDQSESRAATESATLSEDSSLELQEQRSASSASQGTDGHDSDGPKTLGSQLTASEARAESFTDLDDLEPDEPAAGSSSNRRETEAKQTIEHGTVETGVKSFENEIDEDKTKAGRSNLEEPVKCRAELTSDSRKQKIMEMVSEYCDKLVAIIKEEALKQVEFILNSDNSASERQAAGGDSIEHLSLTNRLESSCSSRATLDSCNDCGGGESGGSHSGEMNEQVLRTSCRRIYTSSLFYDDKQNSFPTIEEELDRSQTIVKQLEMNETRDDRHRDSEEPAPGNDHAGGHVSNINESLAAQAKWPDQRNSRASLMFKKRRERMRHFTIGSSYDLELDPGSDRSREFGLRRTKSSFNLTLTAESTRTIESSDERKLEGENCALTDTEYEAPQVSRCKRLESAHIGSSDNAPTLNLSRPKYKPFLDSSTLKNIERLRECYPEVDFNDHQNVSPEVCHKLADDLKPRDKHDEGQLKKTPSRGAAMFERRQLQSVDWIVSGDGDQANATTNTQLEAEMTSRMEETNADGDSASGMQSRAAYGEETVMVAESAWQEQLIELAPVVSSHQQPQLELATITRTPSFSASSRRVVECDSPDNQPPSDDESPPSESITSSAATDQSGTDEEAAGGGRDDELRSRAGLPDESLSHNQIRPDAARDHERCQLAAGLSQPRIQVNDRDLVELSDSNPEVGAGQIRLRSEPDFGDESDLFIAHTAVVKSPLVSDGARRGLKCHIERLTDRPQLQFATIHYHGLRGARQQVVGEQQTGATRTTAKCIVAPTNHRAADIDEKRSTQTIGEFAFAQRPLDAGSLEPVSAASLEQFIFLAPF